MKFSRHTLKLIRNAAAGPGLAASAALGAPLIYDLRFADGQHTKMPMAGDLLTVELWERVTGTNATVTDEKLGGGYAVIISEQIDGGYMLNGGFTSGSRVAPFAGSGSRDGSNSDLNADGIVDWGSTSTGMANTNYLFYRTNTVGAEAGGGTIGQAAGAGWEFKIAEFTLTVGTLSSDPGSTSFRIVKPNGTSFVSVIYTNAGVDGSAFNVTSSNQQGAYADSIGITLLTPEPSVIGLLAACPPLLIRRRRQGRDR